MGGADPKKNRADRRAAYLTLAACLDLRDGVPYSEVYKKYRADVSLVEPGLIVTKERIDPELYLMILMKNLVRDVAGAAIDALYLHPPGDSAAARSRLAEAIEILAPFPAWMKDEALAALAALDLGEVRPLLAPARPGRRAGYTLARWRLRFVALVRYRQAAGGSVEQARRRIGDKIGASPETLRAWERRLPAFLASDARLASWKAKQAEVWAWLHGYAGGDPGELFDGPLGWAAVLAQEFERDWADLDVMAAAYRAACRKE